MIFLRIVQSRKTYWIVGLYHPPPFKKKNKENRKF